MTSGQIMTLDLGRLDGEERARWRELALQRENPFLTPEWFECWHDPAGESPWVLAWTREPGSPPAAILPLVCARRGGVRRLHYPGPANGDWFGIACGREDEADALDAFLAELRSRAGEWDVLHLDRVPADGPWGRERNRTSTHPFDLRRSDDFPFLDFGADGYEGWLGSRSRNFRSQLGRRRRRAERDHRLSFDDTPDQESLATELAVLFRLHEARRRMLGQEVLDGAARAAYSRFARLSRDRGWLRMHRMSLDDQPVASWLGWRIGDRYCYGLSGFDPAWEDLAVGTLMLAHTIECAADEGARVYDFLWGDERYKDRYATGRRTVVSLAAAAGLRGRLDLAARRSLRRVSDSISQPARERLRRMHVTIRRR